MKKRDTLSGIWGDEKRGQATVQIRERINSCPLLIELADRDPRPAAIRRNVFVQDDFYLRGYARALAMLGLGHRTNRGQDLGWRVQVAR